MRNETPRLFEAEFSLFLCIVAASLAALFIISTAEGSVSPTSTYLRGLPPHWDDRDEAPNEREGRLDEIALEIDGATEDRTERAMLLVLGWGESRWHTQVGDGDIKGDDGKAFGYFQSWEHDRSGGVRGQVERAIKHLRVAGNYCVSRGFERVQGSFALYGTGRLCEKESSKKRAQKSRRIAGQL